MSSETSITREASDQVSPGRWARPSGWMRGHGAGGPAGMSKPARLSLPLVQPLQPLPGCSPRAGGPAGGLACRGGVAGRRGPGLQPVGPRSGWGRPALPTAGVSAAGLPSPSRLQVAQGASWVPAGAAVPIPSKHYSAQTPAVAGGRGVPSQGGWRVLPLPATHPSCSRGGGLQRALPDPPRGIPTLHL